MSFQESCGGGLHRGCTPAFSDCWASGSQNVCWVRLPQRVWLGLWKMVPRTLGKYVHKTLPNRLSPVLKPMTGRHCTGGQPRVGKKTTNHQNSTLVGLKHQLDSSTDHWPVAARMAEQSTVCANLAWKITRFIACSPLALYTVLPTNEVASGVGGLQEVPCMSFEIWMLQMWADLCIV
jgi:hypothetical protein